MKQKFIEHLQQQHPSLKSADLNGLIAENLLSPHQIDLPISVLNQAQEFIRATYGLRCTPEYLQKLQPEIERRGLQDPGNKSILMSYDFHVDEQGILKLIEVNTNASFLALGFEMYQMRNLPLSMNDFRIEEIGENIRTELQLQGKNIQHPRVSIIDEVPSQQRLYAEFLVYDSYFKKWGFQSRIQDVQEKIEADLVYNRYTDFYLENDKSVELRRQFLSRDVCFSPNPFEYLCLADKQRMIEWSQLEIPALRRNLPQALDLISATADQIWSEKKKYFIKPKRAFGAKQSYRGGSISYRVFEELIDQEFIAQEFISAPERNFSTPQGEQAFKFDLRFYAYQDRVQMVVARIYQGQVTNLKTPGGGFAPVLWHP